MTSETANRSSGQAAPELLIDTQLPQFEARSFYAVVVDAPPEAAYRAVRALDPEQVAQAVPAMRLMGWLRAVPARVSARYRQDSPPAPPTLSADQAENTFVPVAEKPGTEFVVAMIGKFSSPSELEFRRFEPAEFAGFTEAGFGKVAVSFLVLPYGTSRALLCTETRTTTTDPDTARRFQRYWQIIRPFAGYIMRRWLALAKQQAEQAN
jgi:hypothetical protein